MPALRSWWRRSSVCSSHRRHRRRHRYCAQQSGWAGRQPAEIHHRPSLGRDDAGAHWLEDTVDEGDRRVHTASELCSQVGSSSSPMTLSQQAEHIANALKTDLVVFSSCAGGRRREYVRVESSGRGSNGNRLRSEDRRASSSASASRSIARRIGGRHRCDRSRA